MIKVHVSFNYRGQEWSHDFQVKPGTTVLQLKEQMVAPEGGSKVDADSFELRRQGNRIPDFEPIIQESVFEFGFLGPEEGAKKAASDVAAKDASTKAWEDEKRRQDWRRQQQQESEAARAKQREEEEKEKEPPKPVVEVEVTVRHAMEDRASEVTVKVMSNSTILDVRNAVLAAIGETKLSEVKLVKKMGGALTTLKNEAEIGDRREFLSMGRKLLPAGAKAGDASAEGKKQAETATAQPPPVGDVWLKITSTEDGASRSIQMAGTRTVRELKAQLCEEAKRSFTAKVKLFVSGWTLKDADKVSVIAEREWEKVQAEGIELGPPKEVQVKVAHCNSQHSLSVTVLDTINIRELRQAVSEETDFQIEEVKIVRRLMGASNGGWSSLSDSERLNGRTEFFCMGKALEKPPEQPIAQPLPAPVFDDREISISICLDRELGISQEVPVKLGSPVRVLKELLAEGDPTHRTRPEDIGLELSGSPGRPLVDSILLTEEYSQLVLVQDGGQGEAAAEAAVQDEAMGFVWTEKGIGAVQGLAEMAARIGWPSAGDQFMSSHLAGIRQDPQWSWVDCAFLVREDLIKAPGPFELTLTHALDGTSTAVQVLPTASILEVRRAVMLAIGQTKLSEIKLLAKAADGDFEALEDGDSLAGRTHLYTVGCSLV